MERREQQQEIYRELTLEGKGVCALAGFLEETVVLWAFGIKVSMSPVLVLAFLWVLFCILTAAALIAGAWLAERFAVRRTELYYEQNYGEPGVLRLSSSARCQASAVHEQKIAA